MIKYFVAQKGSNYLSVDNKEEPYARAKVFNDESEIPSGFSALRVKDVNFDNENKDYQEKRKIRLERIELEKEGAL